MFRRFHHGHSMLIGGLLAISLYRHALVFALLFFTLGVVFGRSWLIWMRVYYTAHRFFTRRARDVNARVKAALTDPDEIPF